jgi:hypothetical protein
MKRSCQRRIGGDFKTQLEKVVDTYLTFNPSPAEAATIAVTPGTAFASQLEENCTVLGIVNLRVIKKIERLCDRLESLLHRKDLDAEVLKQGIHTATLFGWIHHQPDSAPPFDFVRGYNSLVGLISAKGEASDKEKAWRALLRDRLRKGIPSAECS